METILKNKDSQVDKFLSVHLKALLVTFTFLGFLCLVDMIIIYLSKAINGGDKGPIG